MKNSFIMISAITSIFVGSCNPTEIEKQGNIDFIDYEQVGIDHNEALDRMFTDFEQLKNSDLTYNDAIKVFEKSAIDITNEKHPNLEYGQIEKVVADIDHLMLNQIGSPAQARVDGLEMHEMILNELENELTDQQNTYLNRIIAILTVDEPVIETINEHFDQLENEIQSEVSVEERHALLIAIYTGKASAQYWHDNYAKWVSEFGSTESGRVEGEISWGRAGASDVAAGVLVGTATSTALVVPFIGWGFWGAITGGSAAIVSGGSVLMDIFR